MEGQLNNALSPILHSQERVLLCLPASAAQSRLWKDTLLQMDCIPEFPGDMLRWGALLRCAFDGRFRTIIGSPRVILGLCKLSRYSRTPLYVRNAVLLGHCPHWMESSIADSLDCKTWTILPQTHPEEDMGTLADQEEVLLRWSSVLDVRLIRGPYGLELEAVIFPGKKLPPFPNCARQRVGMWNPESDSPFSFVYDTKNWKNH